MIIDIKSEMLTNKEMQKTQWDDIIKYLIIADKKPNRAIIKRASSWKSCGFGERVRFTFSHWDSGATTDIHRIAAIIGIGKGAPDLGYLFYRNIANNNLHDALKTLKKIHDMVSNIPIETRDSINSLFTGFIYQNHYNHYTQPANTEAEFETLRIMADKDMTEAIRRSKINVKKGRLVPCEQILHKLGLS